MRTMITDGLAYVAKEEPIFDTAIASDIGIQDLRYLTEPLILQG